MSSSTFLIYAPDIMLRAISWALKQEDFKRTTLLRAVEAADMVEHTPHDVLLIMDGPWYSKLHRDFVKIGKRPAKFTWDGQSVTIIDGHVPPVTASGVAHTPSVEVESVAVAEGDMVRFPSGATMEVGEASRRAARAMGKGLMDFLGMPADDQMVEITKLDPNPQDTEEMRRIKEGVRKINTPPEGKPGDDDGVGDGMSEALKSERDADMNAKADALASKVGDESKKKRVGKQ